MFWLKRLLPGVENRHTQGPLIPRSHMTFDSQQVRFQNRSRIGDNLETTLQGNFINNGWPLQAAILLHCVFPYN